MQIKYATLETCHTATGIVVIIDVLRAFTVAAYAFAAGAKDIILVSTVEEALNLRRRIPNALAMGEMEGRPVNGFDFNNSPTAMVGQDFSRRQLIHRTSAGVQGVVRSTQADTLLVGSFVCAEATVQYIRQQSHNSVTFVNTGIIYHRDGDEDIACSDYMAARLKGEQPDTQPFIARVYNSTSGQLFTDPNHPIYPRSDVEYSTAINRFNFAMQAHRRDDGLLVLEKMEVKQHKE